MSYYIYLPDLFLQALAAPISVCLDGIEEKLASVIAELSRMGNIVKAKDSYSLYGSTDTKTRIIITRDKYQAELFDRQTSPQLSTDWMATLLCHGGSLIESVTVNINFNFQIQTVLRPRPACRWYPRSLFTTLLLVRFKNICSVFESN